MDAVVDGVAVEGIEVQFGGDEVDVFGFATAELRLHALDEAVLDALPAPAGIFVLVVGGEAGLSGIGWGGEADGEQGIRRGTTKLSEELFGVGEHLGDFGVGIVGVGGEAVVDAEQEGDDMGRLVVAVFAEVAGEIENGLLRFIGIEEGAGALASERAGGDASGLGIEFGEEIRPLPAAVAFVAHLGQSPGGLVGADHRPFGIAGTGEHLGDLIGVDAGMGEAVSDDEKTQRFALACLAWRDVEHEATAFDDLTGLIFDGDLDGMIADVFIGGFDGPATGFTGAKRASKLEAVVFELFGEDDVVVVDAHLHIRRGIKDGRQGELEIASQRGGGEEAEEQAGDHFLMR